MGAAADPACASGPEASWSPERAGASRGGQAVEGLVVSPGPNGGGPHARWNTPAQRTGLPGYELGNKAPD